MSTRYGVLWPDGTFTGGITDHQRLANSYAHSDGGKPYEVGSGDDPETRTTKTAPAQVENFDDLC